MSMELMARPCSTVVRCAIRRIWSAKGASFRSVRADMYPRHGEGRRPLSMPTPGESFMPKPSLAIYVCAIGNLTATVSVGTSVS